MTHDHDQTGERAHADRHRSPVAWATWLIIAANVAVYLAMVARGDNGLTAEARRLASWGANFGPLTRGGDWWRLLTATFLHGGLLHLLLNMIALRSGGPLLERLLGTSRFVAVYLLAGMGASLGSALVATHAVSVGASGAVFGVYGALLACVLRLTPRGQRWQALRPSLPGRHGGRSADDGEASVRRDVKQARAAAMPPDVSHRLAAEILAVFVLNLLIGLALPGIDNAAHVTGFLVGILIGWIAGDAMARRLALHRAEAAGVADRRDRSAWLLPGAAAAVLVVGGSAAFPMLPHGARLFVFEQACRAGIGSACLAAGRQVQQTPATRDLARALSYFGRGCEAGSRESCNVLGRAQLARGAAGQRAAAQAFTAACARGDAPGCHALAALYDAGLGVARDSARAAQLYTGTCDRNDAYGCLRLSEAYARGRGVPRDERRAAALAARSCDAGEPRGCTLRAAALAAGTGVTADPARAIVFYRKACDNGVNEPVACAELGVRHLAGNGVPKDLKLAVYHYLAIACGRGHAASCTRAGALFEQSTELGVNLPRAAGLYEQGCAAGDAAACFSLGVMYADGRGRDKDLARAAALYENACRRGMRQVCSLAAQLRAVAPAPAAPAVAPAPPR